MTFDKIIKLTQNNLKTALVKELKDNKYSPVVEDGFIYAKGDLPVLLVAHMDTVHKSPVSTICKSADGIWMAPEGIGGDDRCGIYSITQIIKHYKAHVLFTEDEEIGCIGASKFTKSGIKPDVNFIIELDRKGSNDCVFYDCDNKDFQKFIEGYGFETDYGSCSDISDVAPYVGKAAVNLSCGYYNPHCMYEYIKLDDMWNTIRKVEEILSGELTTSYEWIEKVHTYSVYRNGNSTYYYNADYESYYERKHYTMDDKEVQNIIWLFGDDRYFWKRYSEHKYHDCESIGVDSFGRYWFWNEDGTIEPAWGISLYDTNLKYVSGYTLYDKLENDGFKENTIAEIFKSIDDETGDDDKCSGEKAQKSKKKNKKAKKEKTTALTILKN